MNKTQNNRPTPQVFRLRNAHGWEFSYEIRGNVVVVTKSFRGAKSEPKRLPIGEARQHYLRNWNSGFEQYGMETNDF